MIVWYFTGGGIAALATIKAILDHLGPRDAKHRRR